MQVRSLWGALAVLLAQALIRLSFMPRVRLPSAVARAGFILGVELSPGVAYALSSGSFRTQSRAPAFSMTAMIAADFAVW